MDDSRLVGIFLAAGKSSRMGRDKLNLPFGGMALGSRVFNAAIKSKLHFIIAVTRKGNSLQWLAPFDNCEKWKSIEVEGTSQSESLKAGLAAAEKLGADGVLVLLADQPFLSKEMINLLVDEFQQHLFIAFSFMGKGRPPALFSKKLFKSLRGLEGDQGAREILRGDYKEFGKLIEIKDQLPFLDIDTKEDYQKLLELATKDSEISRLGGK